MSMKLALVIGVISVVIAVPVILFFVSRSTNNSNESATYSAEAEQKKFEDDKVITKIYTGTLPCADCTGIDTNLSLSQEDINVAEGTYTMSQRYLEKADDAIVSTGNWTTQRGDGDNPDATVITLNPEDPEKVEFYLQVDPTHLQKLDKDGKEIEPKDKYTLILLQ